MRIGQLAAQSGLSIDAIRFWERSGVLPLAPRTPAGYRIYSDASLARIGQVRRLQGLGLTLDEIASALRAQDEGHASCQTERWRLEGVLDRVEAKIAVLTRLHGEVRAAIAACDAGTCQLASPV
jgi:DNA-binding transcriptional MerR regulator